MTMPFIEEEKNFEAKGTLLKEGSICDQLLPEGKEELLVRRRSRGKRSAGPNQSTHDAW